jgi:hypothetical protein
MKWLTLCQFPGGLESHRQEVGVIVPIDCRSNNPPILALSKRFVRVLQK